jgi:RIP homotypic interaction motif
MDPITLIVTALAAGAALGITDAASSAIKDAYAGLKALVMKQLGSRPDAELVLARHEQAPETWRAPLMAELDQARAGDDARLVAAAEALMRLVDEAGARAGKYAVDVRGAQGVQVGDHNSQRNVFGYRPASVDADEAGR